MIKRKHKRMIRELVKGGHTLVYILTWYFYNGGKDNLVEVENYFNKYRKGGENK